MSESEIKTVNEENLDAVVQGAIESAGDYEPDVTEIRDTDIVFDCPHCGHNLAIDYRGAGLQITCVNCGESVLVPIPDGMKITDLDIEPGEILKQLFAARRNLQKVELRVAELQDALESKELERASLQEMLEAVQLRLDEVREVYAKQVTLAQRTADLLDAMDDDLASDVEVTDAEDDAAEEGNGGEDGALSE